MAVYPWELSIEDGELSAWLHGKLTVKGDLVITEGNIDIVHTDSKLLLPLKNDAANPTVSFGDGDSGLYEGSDDILSIATGGILRMNITATGMYSNTTGGWRLGHDAASATNPALAFAGDSDTGMGLAGADILSLIAGGVEGHRISEVTGAITHELIGDVNVTGDVTSPNLTSKYGEMYIYNNSTATVIETANTPIAIKEISSGLVSGFAFEAGSSADMDWTISDYSGTVPGAVLFQTYTSHPFNTGDIITIRGTCDYTGIHKVYRVTSGTFYIITPWIAGAGTCLCDKGACLTALAGSNGVYTSTWQMTTAPAGACELCFKVNINEIPQVRSTACRDMAVNDKDNNSSTCLLTIADGDIIWLSVESDSTDNIVNSMGNMNLERL